MLSDTSCYQLNGVSVQCIDDSVDRFAEICSLNLVHWQSGSKHRFNLKRSRLRSK